MAIIINEIDSTKFSFNGITYYKNFTPIVRGDNIEVSNTYDRRISLTDSVPVIYSDYTVDGSTYATVELLQAALLPVLFTRASLGGGADPADLISADSGNSIVLGTDSLLFSAGGGGSSASVKIEVWDTDQSSFFTNDFQSVFNVITQTPTTTGHSKDSLIFSNASITNQRAIYLFGGEQHALKVIRYMNYFNNTGGSSTPLNSTRGIQNCTMYAITSDIIPSTTHGSTTGLTAITVTGGYSPLIQQTVRNLSTKITLDASTPCYGFVIDADDNYGDPSLMGFRKITFHT